MDPPAGGEGFTVDLSNPLVRGLLVFAAGAAVGLAGWYPLGLPAGIISGLIPDQSCSGLFVGNDSMAMYLCSARVGLFNLIGPIVVTVALVVFRRPIGGLIGRFRPRIPGRWGFLISPVLASGFFTMAYAGIHWETASRGGILDKRLFPGLIGLLAYLIPGLVRNLAARRPDIFDRRDRIPGPARVVLSLIVPLVLAFAWTRGSGDVASPVFKEQIVILLSASLGFLAFAPRSGSVAGMAQSVARTSAGRWVGRWGRGGGR